MPDAPGSGDQARRATKGGARAARRAALVACLLVAAAAACGDDDGSVAAGDDGDLLVGRVFLSEEVVEDGAPRELVSGTQIQLSFPEDGGIRASAGCNTMLATLELDGDRMVIGDVGSTEMGCDSARQEQDEWLAGVLSADPVYVLDGDRLRLDSDGTVIELVDREVADPDRALEGTVWQLDGIIDGDAVSTVPGEVPANITFNDGQVAFTVEGCNQGSGEATVTGSTITVGPLQSTLMACPPPAADVEAVILAVLEGEIAYEIEAASLTLTHPSGAGLVLTATD
jgi:heat shock protein HslJ